MVRGEAGVTEKPISRKQDRTQPHIDAIKPRLSGMDNGSECEKPTLAGESSISTLMAYSHKIGRPDAEIRSATVPDSTQSPAGRPSLQARYEMESDPPLT